MTSQKLHHFTSNVKTILEHREPAKEKDVKYSDFLDEWNSIAIVRAPANITGMNFRTIGRPTVLVIQEEAVLWFEPVPSKWKTELCLFEGTLNKEKYI